MREAVMGDLKQILYIYHATFNDTIRNPEKYYKKYIKQGNVMVLDKNGIIYGAYVWEINRMRNIFNSKSLCGSRFLWLRQVMVDPEHQGHGLGRMLMLDFMMKSNYQMRLVCEQHLVEWYKRFSFLCDQVCYHNKKELYLMRKDG